MESPRMFFAGPEEEGRRLDLFLTDRMPELSRSALQKLIAGEQVTVDGKVRTKPGFALQASQTITLVVPAPVLATIEPQSILLDILYEDDALLVVNKARGMVVHPSAGHARGTLVNALMAYCNDLSGINGVLRPGIVHRLDKDTSGVMLVAKTDRAHIGLASQIKDKTAARVYQAIVHGHLRNPSGTVVSLIGRHPTDRKKMAVVSAAGKQAVTHYRALEELRKFSLVECRLETGRTHQIRVHMAHIGHPVLGDPKYSPAKTSFAIQGQALHSCEIRFIHPLTNADMHFIAPLPQDMERLLQQLR